MKQSKNQVILLVSIHLYESYFLAADFEKKKKKNNSASSVNAKRISKCLEMTICTINNNNFIVHGNLSIGIKVFKINMFCI